jgi:hypothetical protein
MPFQDKLNNALQGLKTLTTTTGTALRKTIAPTHQEQIHKAFDHLLTTLWAAENQANDPERTHLKQITNTIEKAKNQLYGDGQLQNYGKPGTKHPQT